MNMYKGKTRRVITIIIVAVLVLAMIVPLVASLV